MGSEEHDDVMDDVFEELSTSAQLLLRLEAAIHELTSTEGLLAESPQRSSELRELRRVITACRSDLQSAFDWLSEAPLEEPRN
jgi:hypothetical protein